MPLTQSLAGWKHNCFVERGNKFAGLNFLERKFEFEGAMIDLDRADANFGWLYDDLRRSRELVTKDGSQFARRTYLRALSAWYELTLSGLREKTAALLVEGYESYGKLNLHEIMPLLDETVMLSGNGRLHLAPNRQPFISLVAYTLKTFAKLIKYPEDVLSDSRWQSFCATVKIRHRITHPKFHSEIEITDEEFETIEEGRAWWDEVLESLWAQYYRVL